MFVFEDWGELGLYIKQMIGAAGNHLVGTEFLYHFRNYGVLFLSCMVLAMPFYPWVMKRVVRIKQNWIGKMIKGGFVLGYVVCFILAVAFLVSDTYNPFLYFRF